MRCLAQWLMVCLAAACVVAAQASAAEPADQPAEALRRIRTVQGAAAPHVPAPLETSCVVCHKELDGKALEPAQRAPDDVHFQRGLSCHDCHGGNPAAGADGDPDAAHDASKGWTGAPPRTRIPDFCARCHQDATYMKRFNPRARVDQLSEYRTSVHGQRNATGDTRTATCVDCHGVHGIRAVSDPRSPVSPANVADTCGTCHDDTALMKSYALRADQHQEYKRSVHAAALYEKGDSAAPTCNDCHGSHGAVPPGLDVVSNVCGTCHAREATLFREIEAKKMLDLEPCIQCVVCHGNHAVMPPSEEMIGVGPGSTCTGCHAEGDLGYKAAAEMGDGLHRLAVTLGQAQDLLERAERAGVEVGPDRFALRAAHDSLVESRVLVHSFDLEKFRAASTEGLRVAETGIVAGRRAFAELRHRRIGLGLSLIVIASVISGLVLAIRRIER